MNGELLRLVESIARDKNIDRDVVFQGIEGALLSASRKQYGPNVQIDASVDRMSGQMSVAIDGVAIEPRSLGRIAAQAAKQVMIQKNREAERSSIYEEYSQREGSIISGQVSRIEHGNIIVNLGRTEGFLPRSEQIPGEAVHEADRIRALVLDVRESGSHVKIVLSRTHADFIRRLFELEVPEVADRIIEIRGIAREAGQRTKIAVTSIDTRVDAVGACVGIRGSRIKTIVEELGGEKIDIVRFNESSQVFIANALRPAEVEDIYLAHDIGRATVIVPEDQLSLAIGKRGQNVRLAARLTGWDIDIMMAEEYEQQRDNAVNVLAEVPGMNRELAEQIAYAGFVSLSDIAQLDPEILTHFDEVDEDMAASIVDFASVYVRQLEMAKQTIEAEGGEQAAEGEAAAGEEGPAADQAQELTAAAIGGAMSEIAAAEQGEGDAEAEAPATVEDEAAEPETVAEETPPTDVDAEPSADAAGGEASELGVVEEQALAAAKASRSEGEPVEDEAAEPETVAEETPPTDAEGESLTDVTGGEADEPEVVGDETPAASESQGDETPEDRG